MCGIAGIMTHDALGTAFVHRGPDGGGRHVRGLAMDGNLAECLA